MKTIRGKLMMTYLALIIVIILILGIFLLSYIERSYKENLQDKLHSQAILIASMNWDSFQDTETKEMEGLTREISQKIGPRITIINIEGKVLGDSDEDVGAMENHRHRKEIVRAYEKGMGVSTRYSSTLKTEMLYVAVPVLLEDEPAGFVRVALPLTEVNRAVRQIWSMIIITILIASLVSGVISLKFARSITRPLEEMTRKAKVMAQGNFNQKIYTRDDDEVAQLGEAFNYMAQTLKEKVQEIVKGKEQLESLLSSIVSGIILLDREGKIVLTNPAAEAIISFSREEVLGKSHLSLLRNLDLSNKVEKVYKTGKPERLEIVLNYPYEKILEVHVAPVTSSEGDVFGLVLVFHDITEIRRLEKVRSEFIANVSHELRTPVTSVKGFTETLLEEDTLQDPQAVKEFVTIINQEAERLSRLISDLLELSRIEGQGPLKFAPVNLKMVAEETFKKLKPQLKKKKLTLNLDCPSTSPYVLGDEDKIYQVFLNLLDNSVKYTPEEGEIQVTLKEEGKNMMVIVKDTGIGIPQDEISRIFERFYRVDKTRSRKYGGTGLGLTIVKHIIEAHHGSIWVESMPSRGVSFYFTLPKRTPSGP